MKIDKNRLVEIRARVENATPGPWTISREWYVDGMAPDKIGDKLTALEPHTLLKCDGPAEVRIPNATFIAHARQDVPDLLDALEKVQSENERLREALRLAEVRMSNWGICVICNNDFVEQGHADDCPFAALEPHPEPDPPQLATTESVNGMWTLEE